MFNDSSLFIIFIAIVFIIILHKLIQYCRVDNFQQVTNNIIVYVFLSRTCPHCTDYVQYMHQQLSDSLTSNNITLIELYGDTDPQQLFKKFNVMYVPTCVVSVNGVTQQLEGAITPENVQTLITNLLKPLA